MKRISISLTDEYIDVYGYLKGKANISKYVCELVRQDMNGLQSFSMDDIERLIDNKLKNLSRIEIDNNEIEEDIRGDLSDLFGL